MARQDIEGDLLALLRELVAIPSTFPPGNTERIVLFCRDFLSGLGYETRLHEKTKGVQNLVAGCGRGKPSIVFNAHVDTVGVGERAAWRTDPFCATLADGRVYGLGACNCKASMAVQLWLAKEIARRGGPKRGELVFTFVGDEENLGTDGMAYLRDMGAIKPDTLIVAAPTRNRIVYEERGVMWVKVTTRGRAAHAGAPHAGESAILKMNHVVSQIQNELLPDIAKRKSTTSQQATLSIGRIRGGENINVVPDLCVIELDRRLLSDEDFDSTFEQMRSFMLKSGAQEVELLTGTPGFSASGSGAGARAFAGAVREVTGKPPERLNVVGASDGRYFARDGIEILVTGPGDGADSHIPNEHVALGEMIDAAQIQLGAVEKLLGFAEN
jgi:acetylornithine deacetylase/succinyl-diaminopimelate desuccinylase family protein